MSSYSLRVLIISLALSGCSTLSHKPPSCSGYEQRPLNRSMWQWEGTQPAAPASPSKPQTSATENTAPRSARFDEAASRRSCGLV